MLYGTIYLCSIMQTCWKKPSIINLIVEECEYFKTLN